MNTEAESVILALTIQKRRSGVDFYAMHTPKELWQALPWKEQIIPAYEDAPSDSFKQFTVKFGRKTYEFTFYRGRP